MITIAIDGPSAAGKSTIAKKIATILHITYIDTGAMYRCVTLFALRNKVDCQNNEAVKNLLNEIHIQLNKDSTVYLNGEDVTFEIRTQPVVSNVSFIAANKDVRLHLVHLQREMAQHNSVVMDGRDIGTYVLPDADVKIFQTASVEKRAERRYLENISKGISCNQEDIEKDLQRRDYIDSHRDFAPLRKAVDAIEVDTSNLSIEESVNKILFLIKQKVGDIHE